MNSLEQVKENLAAAEKTTKLTPHESTLVSKVARHFVKSGFIRCTKCRYCAHCPKTVVIPEVLSLLNEWSAAKRRGINNQDQLKAVQKDYNIR
jgi:predicted aldo/keto reductase-like oxidoreductase